MKTPIMKTTLLSILLLFFFITAFSQIKGFNNTHVNPEGKLFLGAEIGGNKTHEFYIEKDKNSFQFGLIAEYYFTRYDDNVISGTFYCTVKNYLNPEDIIEVTEGRFDFNRNTINTTKFP